MTLWSFLQVALVLAAMAWLGPVLVRRTARRVGPGAGQRLRVLESASCGGNRVLCLVRADHQELLLGVTDAGITLLQVLEGSPAGDEAALPATGGGFLEQLHKAWPGRRDHDRG